MVPVARTFEREINNCMDFLNFSFQSPIKLQGWLIDKLHEWWKRLFCESEVHMK